MMNKLFTIKSPSLVFIFLMILSLGFGNFNIQVGFAVKPYMIVYVITLFFTCTTINHNRKLKRYEAALFLYVLAYMLTILNCVFIKESLWYSFAFILVLGYYLTYRRIIPYVTTSLIERSIEISGVIICVCSLVYYLMGIYALDFIPALKGASAYGVIVDRFMFRLTGTVNEPNITPFILSPYFFYYLYNYHARKLCKFGLFLMILTIYLTLSRGAYLSYISTIFLVSFLFANNLRHSLVISVKYLLLFIGGCYVVYVIAYNIYDIDFIAPIIERFEDIEDDGGSGRLDLWNCAFKSFWDNPILGIGLNATRAYNVIHYGKEFGNYTHNSHLEVLAEGGIVVFLFYVSFWILLLHKSYVMARLHTNARYLFSSLIAMFAQMCLVSVQFHEIIFFLVLLVFRYDLEYERRNSSISVMHASE